MEKVVLKPETKLNAILVVDKKNEETFMSQHLNMTLEEYLTRSMIMSVVENAPSLPKLYNMELDFVMNVGGRTSKGYFYESTAYKHEDDDVLVFVNVIDKILAE